MWTTIAPVTIATIALLVSVLTLWRTHLAPFHLISTTGPIRLRVEHLKVDKKSWWLPRFAVSVSLTNSGARIGRVTSMRIVVHYPAIEVDDAYEAFRCLGEFDLVEHEKDPTKPFRAFQQDFVPIVLLPKETVIKFLVFQTRWDSPVTTTIEVGLEVQTDASKDWRVIDTWVFHLDEIAWKTTEEGHTLISFTDDTLHMDDRNPADLHQHTNPAKHKAEPTTYY